MTSTCCQRLVTALVLFTCAGCLVDINGPDFKQYDHQFTEEVRVGVTSDTVYLYLEQIYISKAGDSSRIEVRTEPGLTDSLRLVLHVVGKTDNEEVNPYLEVFPIADTAAVWYALNPKYSLLKTSPPPEWKSVERWEVYKPTGVEVVARNRFY